MATIKDVAQLSGVSIATVSRVINKSGYIDKETEKRVLSAIQELNYTPNHLARSLIKRRTQTLGLILPDITNPFFPLLARAIEDIAQQNKYSVMYCNSDNDILKLSKSFKLLKDRSVDGMIIAGDLSQDHIEVLSQFDIPIAVIDSNVGDAPVHQVFTDNVLGARIAVNHLLEQGYRRIAHIRGEWRASTARNRHQGYMEALQEWDIPYDPILVQPGDYQIQSGYEAMLRLLALASPPDAVFAANDLMALGAIHAILEHQLRIPEDIGVVGFDDLPLTKVLRPSLTTVRQSIYDMGVISTKLQLESIENPPKEKEDYKVVVLDPVLQVRETSLRKKEQDNIE
ncbi:MAG: LacI family DNA-binding transcriptional regulator [Clostridia bacterium]|jgi:LacI family transcriptional regulator